MLKVFLGQDDFSKHQLIKQQVSGLKAQVEIFSDLDNPPAIETLLAADLFSTPKIFILEGLFSKLSYIKDSLEVLKKSANQIYILETKLDGRLLLSKALLPEAREFLLPHLAALNSWIVARVKLLNGQINFKAVELLAGHLGRDDFKTERFGKKTVMTEAFNLWQADSEIRKLLALATGREITPDDVMELVPVARNPDTLRITDAIAAGRKAESFKILEQMLNFQEGDEKTRIIQFTALFAEQLRALLIMKEFTRQNISDGKIVEKTGWKPGRVAVLKRIGGRLQPLKIIELLKKLEFFDEELKTTSAPPKTILTLILSQAF